MFPYDLHTHSSFSDGDFNLETLFKRATQAKLKGVVVTDHNQTEHISKALSLAKRDNLWTCQGTELTNSYRGIDIHILGYSLAFDFERLNRGIVTIQKGYNERAEKIIKKLSKIGIEVDYQKIRSNKPAPVIFRYDIAKAIASHYRYSIGQARKLIGRLGPAWEPYGRWVPAPAQAVELIHRSNGIAVLAHPGDIKRSTLTAGQVKPLVNELIATLARRGLDGLEVCHPSHSATDRKRFSALAERFQLVKTGGSDWHGEIHHPDIAMGQCGTTDGEFELFHRYLQKKSRQ